MLSVVLDGIGIPKLQSSETTLAIFQAVLIVALSPLLPAHAVIYC